MATFKITGKRDPIIAEGKPNLSCGWSHENNMPKRFSVSVDMEDTPSGRARFATFEMSESEAINLSGWIAKNLTREPDMIATRDHKTPAQALRDLADLIEKGESD